MINWTGETRAIWVIINATIIQIGAGGAAGTLKNFQLAWDPDGATSAG